VVVLDPQRSLLLDGTLGQLHSPADGRIHCTLLSGAGRVTAVVNAILAGLGKHASGPDLPNTGSLRGAFALAWLEGDEISEIFLSEVDYLNPQTRSALFHGTGFPLTEVASAGRRLWLICANPWLAKTLVENCAATEMDVVAFREYWSGPPTSAPLAPPALFPRVPNEDFVRFRLACYYELDRHAFTRVNKLWRQTLTRELAWLDEQPHLSEELIHDRLRELVAVCGDYNQAVVVVRACQVALFRRDYLLKVKMSLFAHEAKNAAPADLERGAAERLRWFASSARAAAGLIRILAPDVGLDAIASLEASAVAEDGSSFTIGGRTVAVPPSSRGIFRAQHAARRRLGAPDPRYLLYVSSHATIAPTADSIRTWLREITRDAGVPVATTTTARRRLTATQWMRRRGLLLQPLATK
jgi:hypothetical protein